MCNLLRLSLSGWHSPRKASHVPTWPTHRSRHSVTYLCTVDGSPGVGGCFPYQRSLHIQLARFLGGLDGHFELGTLIFFDLDRLVDSEAITDLQGHRAGSAISWDAEAALKGSKVVRLERQRCDFVVVDITHGDCDILADHSGIFTSR